MTDAQLILVAILFALFALLAWGRWRYDVVALTALCAAVVVGVVPAGEAFLGFGHPATITVAAILVLSRALTAASATDWMTKAVAPATKRTTTHIGALSGLAALLSCFMNNVGTLGLLMPLAMQSARKAKRSAALLLMPLSFGAILGGMVTLVGTPPNIIIATYRGEALGEPFRMFDFTPVGLSTAIVGILFVTLVGWRLIPQAARKRAVTEEIFQIENYLAEFAIDEDSAVAGKNLMDIADLTKDADVVIVGIVRKERMRRPVPNWQTLRAGDRLVVEGASEEIDKFASALGVALSPGKDSKEEKKGEQRLREEDAALVEAVIGPGSRLEGQTVGAQRLITRHGFVLLAVSRQGRPYRGRLKTFRFQVGDVLLLHGEAERLADALAAFGCLPLAERGINIGQRRKAPALIALFAAAIAAASFGLLPIQVALPLALVGALLSGLISARSLYEGVDWPVIVLLGALIPVGGALQTTGLSEVIAETIHEVSAGGSVVFVLVLLMVVTMTLSDVLNNAATAVVMAPIALGIAERLAVNPDPFLMAIAVAASCAFLTPIGHQNNALIMGPGGYRFWDYWRMGLPLELLIIAVSIPVILLVWPL
jgi:di/tricarboxylate transporter